MKFSIRVNGAELAARAGDSVAAALAANGHVAVSTAKDGTPRGGLCGMGVCHDCIVTIDGRPGQRACLTPAADGMTITTETAYRPDITGLTDLAAEPEGELPRHTIDVAVVGAGPGGLAAAIAAASAGLSVLVIDERPKPGGQYYKQPASSVPPDPIAREGAARIRQAIDAGAVLHTDTIVWGAFRTEDGSGELALLRHGRAGRLAFRFLVIATGAFERPQIVPGWTLPGVMTTGACQTLVRGHGVAPGKRVLFAGNGPLQLATAISLLRMGGTVVAVADPASPWRHPAAVLDMALAAPTLLGQGIAAMARLTRAGVPLLWRHRLLRIEGGRRVERATLEVNGQEKTFDVDTVCLGAGFSPASELSRLLGCAHRLDANGEAQVIRDDNGATSLPDVFVVGEAGGFGGAHVARAQGSLAGFAIAGRTAPPTARQALARARKFQSALWTAFAAPPLESPADDVVLCRCEALTAGHLRNIAGDEQIADIATLKRLTRAGMGRCQGRYCAPHLPGILGLKPGTEADLLAPQMPLRPIPLASIAVEKPEWGGHRRALLPADRAPDAPPLPIRHAEIVIIGAGVAGLSTTLFLARAGCDVVVIDAGRPNAMASGGNAGSLHVQLLSFDFGAKAEAGGSPAARTLPLQRDSVALWRDLEAELNLDFEIKITGGLMVAETEAQLRFLHEKTALERSCGIESHVIGRNEVASMEPNLTPDLIAAAYCPQEGKINPLVATQGLLDAARQAGARVFDQTTLRAIERTGPGFSLHTNRGTLSAGRVVNAAGSFAARVGEMLNLNIPVFGAPLQMIVTEAVAPAVAGLVAHADRHLTLKQAANGNFIIGGGWTATLDPIHQRPRPLRDSLEGNAWVALRVVPGLRKLHMLRSWAAMNINIDGAPILGEHPGVPGFFNAVSSNGYTLGPILGRLTADLMLRGETDRDVAAFSIARF